MFDPWKQSSLNAGIAKIKDYKPAGSEDIESIDDLKRLAGVGHATTEFNVISNADKAKYERDNNIKRGSPEWFKLWFARPGLTGESPFGEK